MSMGGRLVSSQARTQALTQARNSRPSWWAGTGVTAVKSGTSPSKFPAKFPS